MDRGEHRSADVLRSTRPASTQRRSPATLSSQNRLTGQPVYAGIGSRRTPDDVLAIMRTIGERLALLGWTLRSGGAPGADAAFESGCDDGGGRKQIFLPWPDYNGHPSTLHEVTPAMARLAERYHPNWETLPETSRLLIARNGAQVLGSDLTDPVTVVVCWTSGGRLKGGSAQALRIAADFDVPCVNLGDPTIRRRAMADPVEPILGAAR